MLVFVRSGANRCPENHVPNLCRPANNMGMKDLVVLHAPHDRVAGIARQTSNGLYQLPDHDIPHLGSQSLARELHVRRWPLNRYSNAWCLFPSGEMSPSLSLSLSVSTHLQLTLPLVLSASLSFYLVTYPGTNACRCLPS